MSTISTARAIELASPYEKGPHTRQGIILAGKQGGFIHEAADGFHWEVDEEKFLDFLELMNERHSISSLAKELRKNPGTIFSTMLKLRIILTEKLGVRYLENDDAEKIRKYFE